MVVLCRSYGTRLALGVSSDERLGRNERNELESRVAPLVLHFGCHDLDLQCPSQSFPLSGNSPLFATNTKFHRVTCAGLGPQETATRPFSPDNQSVGRQ